MANVNTWWWAIGLAALAPVTAVSAQDKGSDKKLYCWEQAGRKVCSDALPPEQAAAARAVLSSRSGRTLDRIARPLTTEERMAAARTARQAALQADADRAVARRDLAMVESYGSEADLRRAFGERIILVDESIKGATLAEENLRRGLVSLLGQAANLELTDKPVPQSLRDSIGKQHATLQQLLATLTEHRIERSTLDVDLDMALQRYRDLKASDSATHTQ